MAKPKKIQNREVRKLVEEVSQRGWCYSISGGGHVRLQHPVYGLVFLPMTPSDARSLRNARALIARTERKMNPS